jgi:hypothetical protein
VKESFVEKCAVEIGLSPRITYHFDFSKIRRRGGDTRTLVEGSSEGLSVGKKVGTVPFSPRARSTWKQRGRISRSGNPWYWTKLDVDTRNIP